MTMKPRRKTSASYEIYSGSRGPSHSPASPAIIQLSSFRACSQCACKAACSAVLLSACVPIDAKPSERVATSGFKADSELHLSGKNSYLDWAKIIDCGDAPLTFLVQSRGLVCSTDEYVLTVAQDNTAALRQLDKAHKVRHQPCTTLDHNASCDCGVVRTVEENVLQLAKSLGG